MTPDRVQQLREDTAGGPAALAASLEAYAAEGGPLVGIGDRPTGIAFTGLGSSRYAALTAASEARRLGIPAWPELASSAAPTPPSPGQVLVAISASGRTRETVESARRYRTGGGRVIAMTNEPASALAVEADHVLPLLAGAEGAGIATRTFRATLAVCAMLIRRWADPAWAVESLRPTVARLEAVMAARDVWLPAAVELFEGRMAIDVLGDDADAALVHQAALMLREAPRQPAVPHDTADWLHTAVYLALPGHRALLFSGSELDGEVVDTIRRRGGETVVIGSPVDGAALTIELPQSEGPLERAIVAAVVAELLSAELWRRTTAEDAGPS
ncbi:MAG TPA: SIS domain-containing protein [Candidatus Limnocylindrales bacterium]|nr:SIS domain-containing protein [Candidatus Limnocylindrales bacterium]